MQTAKRLLATTLLALATAAQAQAQNEVAMKLDVVAWGDSIGGLSFKTPKGDGKIVARAFTYSDPVSYSGPRLLAIHQSGSTEVAQDDLSSTPDDEAHQSVPLPLPEPKLTADDTPVSAELARRREEEPTLVALAALPANSRRATILLAPAAAGTYRAYVIDDDPSKLPPGSLRAHNLSPFRIALQFAGQRQRELKPGENFVLRTTGGHAAYRLAYRQGDQWIVQENNLIPTPDNQQTQFVVLKSDNRFFLSSDGASGGFLQSVTLTRDPER